MLLVMSLSVRYRIRLHLVHIMLVRRASSAQSRHSFWPLNVDDPAVLAWRKSARRNASANWRRTHRYHPPETSISRPREIHWRLLPFVFRK